MDVPGRAVEVGEYFISRPLSFGWPGLIRERDELSMKQDWSCATRQGTCQSCGQGGKVVPWLRDMWKSSLCCRSVASGIAEAGQLSPVLFAPALIRKGSPWMICSMEEERQS